jgi:hypothetical protein
MSGLGLANKTTEHAGQGHSFVHSTARRSWGQSLQVERKVVLDRGGGLDGFNFEGGTNVRQRARAEGKGLGVVGLPSLVFGAEIKSARVLKVRRKHNGLVAGLARQLNTEVPGIQGHKGEFQVLRQQVFLGKRIESVDSVTEAAC